MFRSILLPSIIVCIIALPLILATAKKPEVGQQQQLYGPNGYQVGHQGGNSPTFLPNGSIQPGQRNPFQQANGPVSFQTAPMGNPVFQNNQNPAMPATNPAIPIGSVQRNASPTWPPSSQTIIPPNVAGQTTWVSENPNVSPASFGNMTPDFGAAQTFVFPGNANGPDLNAAPMEFMPVTNLAEVIRFNVDPAWVKQRWKRVSTTPDEPGLHGLRVALVTGTNSWDLHGSLTYYFDERQRVQRITFRGWAGDATRLTNLLTQSLGFQQQPTHWAGFYLAKVKRKLTGGLLMQDPPVLYTDNPVQQVALVLEINNQQGPFELSDDFRSLIAGSQRSR